MSFLPWRRLRGPLDDAGRRSVERIVRGLLDWQRDLRRWPRLGEAPDATPFVSLYAGGKLRGCFGHTEGTPAERLARAFVRALEDDRYGRVTDTQRSDLAALVCYPRAVRAVRSELALERVEPGRHGVALLGDSGPVVLLPQVARDHGLVGAGLFATLARKAGLDADAWRHRTLCMFEMEEIAIRPRGDRALRTLAPQAEAAAFLASLVDTQGRVAFGVSGLDGETCAVGPMHHGRAAVVIDALRANRGHSSVVPLASRWLEREISSGLAGRAPRGWPEHPAMIAGTLALACRAGLDLSAQLLDYTSSHPEIAREPWHAAQVVSVLGAHAPRGLWRACTSALRRTPWAPWTAMAARRLGDAAVLERAEVALVAGFRPGAPFEGAVAASEHAELALTALAVEALEGARASGAPRAVRRARAFLLRHQLRRSGVPMPLRPAAVGGAFPLSPVASFARGDVSGHALLALAVSPTPH